MYSIGSLYPGRLTHLKAGTLGLIYSVMCLFIGDTVVFKVIYILWHFKLHSIIVFRNVFNTFQSCTPTFVFAECRDEEVQVSAYWRGTSQN